jgi:hypothetical protein
MKCEQRRKKKEDEEKEKSYGWNSICGGVSSLTI